MKRLPLLILLLFFSYAFADYSSNEILVIPWGEGSNELEILDSYWEYNEGPNPDSSKHREAGGGPSKVFVDRQENFYFMSYEIGYLKGFDNSGSVIVDYTEEKDEFSRQLFGGMYINFYVDSLGRIYCAGNEIIKPYVTVVDRNSNILDKLYLREHASSFGCTLIDWGSDDVLTFLCFEKGMYTYRNGQFLEGGSEDWYAADGYYYSGRTGGPSSIKLVKMTNPDTTGLPGWADTTYIPYEPGNLISGGLIGVDDSMTFYFDFLDSTSTQWGVRVYNSNLVLLDEFRLLPRRENQYLWDTPYPFLRHDGNIYEFHCRDDGMHVFRWSKQ